MIFCYGHFEKRTTIIEIVIRSVYMYDFSNSENRAQLQMSDIFSPEATVLVGSTVLSCSRNLFGVCTFIEINFF